LSLVIVLKEYDYFDRKGYPCIEQLVKDERPHDLIPSNSERRDSIIEGHTEDIENSRSLICRNIREESKHIQIRQQQVRGDSTSVFSSLPSNVFVKSTRPWTSSLKSVELIMLVCIVSFGYVKASRKVMNNDNFCS